MPLGSDNCSAPEPWDPYEAFDIGCWGCVPKLTWWFSPPASVTATLTATPTVSVSPTPTKGSVYGVVLDDLNGRNYPVIGAVVKVGLSSATTGSDGSYTISDLQPGNITVEMTAAQYQYRSTTVSSMVVVGAIAVNVEVGLGVAVGMTVPPPHPPVESIKQNIIRKKIQGQIFLRCFFIEESVPFRNVAFING